MISLIRKSWYKKGLAGLICMLPSLLLNGAVDTLTLGRQFTQSDIRDYGGVYLESTHENNYFKIANLPDGAFQPLKETGISFSPQKAVHWVKFYVKNESLESKKIILEIRNPRINKLQVYLAGENGLITPFQLSGDDFPFHNRLVKHRYFLFPFTVAVGEVQTVYVYADKYSETILLKMLLYDENYFQEADQTSTFIFSLYIGVLLCICLLIGIASLFVRKLLLLYFLLYSASVSLILIAWTGLGFQYFWPNHPYFNSICGNLFNIVALVSLMVLTRTYLETKKHFPRFDLLLVYLHYLLVTFLLYLFFYRLFSDSIGHVIVILGMFFQLLYMGSIFMITLLTYRKESNLDHLVFLSGFFFALLASIVHLLVNLDVFDSNLVIENIVFLGFLLDIFALLFIISNEIRKAFIKNLELRNSVNKWKVEAAIALLEGQRVERQRLSQELHDGLSIHFATLKMRMSNLLGEFQNGALKIEAEKLLNGMGKIAELIRNFTHALAPLDLSEQTLKEAITDLVFDIETLTPDLTIESSLDDFQENSLSELACHTIYQCLQELLNNALKHSMATYITIQLSTKPEEVILIVKDNGKGFDAAHRERGIGLKNIQSRAAFLNGKLSIKTTVNGSCFTLCLPV